MTRIEQLEQELRQKTCELNTSLKAQHLLHQELNAVTAELKDIKSRVRDIEAFFVRSNNYIYQLQLENQKLRSLISNG